MRLTKALVETGLFESESRVERWIQNWKISLNGKTIKKDVELEEGCNYALELHGNKLSGKYLLNPPSFAGGKYNVRGPI